MAIAGFALGSVGCVGGVFLLIYNGRMLGTLSGLVYNGGYLVGFSALILTHGVLELSAICIATAGGLRLGWALLAPGRLARADAFKADAGDAFGLLAGAVLMLVVAGIIEAFVTPHFEPPCGGRWPAGRGCCSRCKSAAEHDFEVAVDDRRGGGGCARVPPAGRGVDRPPPPCGSRRAACRGRRPPPGPGTHP